MRYVLIPLLIAFGAIATVTLVTHRAIPLRLRVLGAVIILRHPWRASRQWLRVHGIIRLPMTHYCPGCGYRSRRWPKIRSHTCADPNRGARRRMTAAAKRKGTVIV